MGKQKTEPAGGAVKTIVKTIVACSAVFGFIVTYLIVVKNAEIDAKNAQIELLERQVNQLSNIGTVPNDINNLITEFAQLKTQLLPLTIVTQVDPITGRCKFGGMDSPTNLSSDFFKAVKFVEEKKYDLALSAAKSMEEQLPSFLGPHYIRFLVNKEKGYADDTASEAEILVKEESTDKRLADVYVFLMNHYLAKDRKREAEELAIKALELWPQDKGLAEGFAKVFGYTPNVVNDKDPANK